MTPTPTPAPRPSQLALRGLFLGIFVATAIAALAGTDVGLTPRFQSLLGVVGFLSLLIGSSADIRAIPLRTVAVGFGLQWMLALVIINVKAVRVLFEGIAKLVQNFLGFSNIGSEFVFGPLANQGVMKTIFPNNFFILAFQALTSVIFFAALFSLLYHYGILQLFVKAVAWMMGKLLRTSGAETLSVTANVVLGQTEAPLIVKPFIPRMTRSELLALMIGGMATVAGGVMAVYIGMGANAVAILCTSFMAAPASLYVAKILLPETGSPETMGKLGTAPERPHRSGIEAFAGGASEGMLLFWNIIAMLIAFVAGVAMVNFLIHEVAPGYSLELILGKLFSPLAALMGVQGEDTAKMGNLLGKKLILNEFVAYLDLTNLYGPTKELAMDPRTYILAAFALTGFANISSIGIQLGAIGKMAGDNSELVAKNCLLALYGGFIATLLNAAIAGVILDDTTVAIMRDL